MDQKYLPHHPFTVNPSDNPFSMYHAANPRNLKRPEPTSLSTTFASSSRASSDSFSDLIDAALAPIFASRLGPNYISFASFKKLRARRRSLERRAEWDRLQRLAERQFRKRRPFGETCMALLSSADRARKKFAGRILRPDPYTGDVDFKEVNWGRPEHDSDSARQDQFQVPQSCQDWEGDISPLKDEFPPRTRTRRHPISMLSQSSRMVPIVYCGSPLRATRTGNISFSSSSEPTFMLPETKRSGRGHPQGSCGIRENMEERRLKMTESYGNWEAVATPDMAAQGQTAYWNMYSPSAHNSVREARHTRRSLRRADSGIGLNRSPDAHRSKPLPLSPGVPCPGCKMGQSVADMHKIIRINHSSSLKFPEERKRGFCNGCAKVLEPSFQRFTMALPDVGKDPPIHRATNVPPLALKSSATQVDSEGGMRRTPHGQFRSERPSHGRLGTRRKQSIETFPESISELILQARASHKPRAEVPTERAKIVEQPGVTSNSQQPDNLVVQEIVVPKSRWSYSEDEKSSSHTLSSGGTAKTPHSTDKRYSVEPFRDEIDQVFGSVGEMGQGAVEYFLQNCTYEPPRRERQAPKAVTPVRILQEVEEASSTKQEYRRKEGKQLEERRVWEGLIRPESPRYRTFQDFNQHVDGWFF
ncbi:hypothetical protein BX600DRAFT_94136 [Xylariales sp. PMI_506]|nr:hypothetical protein BX600DRAFT_94136 [Xylariales sp. PMI_506]